MRELAAAAQAWTLALSAVVGSAMLLVTAWFFVQGDMWLAVGWLTNAIGAFILFYGTLYLQMTYRTGHDFARLAMINVAQNAIALAALVFVAMWSFYGVCLRATIATAAATVMLHYWRPIRVGPKWNFGHLKHLLIVGGPIFFVGQLYSWWPIINSTLVWKYTGEQGMGLYYLVFNAALALDCLPQALSQVVYPRMAEEYGRTGKLQGLLHLAVKPMAATGLGMIVLIAAGWWLVEPVVRMLLPAFIDAVPAVRWALWAPFIGSFAPVALVFNVVRRQDLYVTAILVGMAAYFACLQWLLRGGVTLVAFPQAMAVGQGTCVLLCWLFVFFLVRKERAAR